MKPDFQMLREILQLAIYNDPDRRAEYAKAKWHIDQILTHRPTDLAVIRRINDDLYAFRQKDIDPDIEAILENATYYLEKAEDEQFIIDNRSEQAWERQLAREDAAYEQRRAYEESE